MKEERQSTGVRRGARRRAVLVLACVVPVLAAQAHGASAAASERASGVFPRPKGDPGRQHYVCYRTEEELMIDGALDEPSWRAAPWTSDFVDIEGELKPRPRFRTRVKMLWDSRFFYVAAELEEPDVWATLTRRDAVVFHDNDFEVFIDPDGDNHEYYELEVNALGTEWDLLLTKPYRDGGTAVDSWDIRGLVTGVAVNGTLNTPDDSDAGWTLELAIPWDVLEECAHRPTPPGDGDAWRVNFSRVEWRTEVVSGRYVKLADPASGRPLSEDNWVWSPQGLINMHYPEMWGLVQFSSAAVGEADVPFVPDPEGPARAALMDLYYRERTHRGSTGAYTTDAAALGLSDPPGEGLSWPPEIHVTPHMFEASLVAATGKVLHVSEDGRIW